MTKLDKAYLAGLFDGEGCITFRYGNNRNKTPAITITNNNEAIIRYIYLIYGGNVYKKWKKSEKHSDCFVWQATKQIQRIHFIKDIRPYVKIKKEVVELVYKFLVSRTNNGLKVGYHLPFTKEENGLIGKIRRATAKNSMRGRLLTCLK